MTDHREQREPVDVIFSHRESQVRASVSRRMSEALAILKDLRNLGDVPLSPSRATRVATLRDWALEEIARGARDWVRLGGDFRLMMPSDLVPQPAGSPLAHVPSSPTPSLDGSPPMDAVVTATMPPLERLASSPSIPPAFSSSGTRPPLDSSLPGTTTGEALLARPTPLSFGSLTARGSSEHRDAEFRAMLSQTGSRARMTSEDEIHQTRIDPAALAGLVDLLGEVPIPTGEAMDKNSVKNEIDMLLLATAEGSLLRWVGLPQRVQRSMVGLFACRARRVQDQEMGAVRLAGLEDRLDPIFSRLSSYSKRYQPGWVKGLSFNHTPDRGSWYEDSVFWWNELQRAIGGDEKKTTANAERLIAKVEKAILSSTEEEDTEAILAAFREALEGGIKADDPRLIRLASPYLEAMLSEGPIFKDLRRFARKGAGLDSVDSGEFPPDATQDLGPPPDWAWWSLVRGKRAVIVGGDRREEARRRLARAFEFASLEWIPLQHENNTLRSLAHSVTAGGIDLVILLRRFVPHQADEVVIPACKAAGVPFVSVETGYGVERVKQAVERFVHLPEMTEPA